MTTKFSAYVQSVAFHMTLSRNMIEALGLIRDCGTIAHGEATPRVSSYSVPIARSLAHRGLVEHWTSVFPQHQGKGLADKIPWVYRLTRAGELTCELLVEAELLHKPQRKSKRKAA